MANSEISNKLYSENSMHEVHEMLNQFIEM